MVYKALDIANYLIEKGVQENNPVSNMKLQKLLYYAQGWNLALYDEPLIEEDFSKWTFGPVIPSIYSRFKKYQANPIDCSEEADALLDERSEKLLNKVYQIYSKYTAIQLSDLSHREAPWLNATDFGIIAKKGLKNYFYNLAIEAQEISTPQTYS